MPGKRLTGRHINNHSFTSADASYKDITGKTSVAHTMLRPAGKVMIDGMLYDAAALTGYIDRGEPVEVIK